jgi:hypothetical protein
LPGGHRLRRARVAFNEHAEGRETPRRPSGVEVKEMGGQRNEYINSGSAEDGPRDPVKVHKVKHTPCLFALPYWSVSPHGL